MTARDGHFDDDFNAAPGGGENARAQLHVEAVDWVVRLTVGELSDADREDFRQWYRADRAHEAAFADASDMCGDLRRIADELRPEDLAAVPETARLLPFTARDQRKGPAGRRQGLDRRGFLGAGGAMAAALATGFVITHPPLELWPSLASLMADERTGVGERRSFSPMAGVQVELNSRSSAYRTARGSGLDLVDGEAFVLVEAGDLPFRVTAKNATLTASRAAFNVQNSDGRLCVTCIDGEVQVSRDGGVERVSTGEELRALANGRVQRVQADETVRLAWRRGLLILRDTPLAEAIPQINRYFPGRLVLTDDSKSGWPVSGVFHIGQIELAVVQLEQLLGVGARRLPGGVVLLG